jgi:DNA (cytosine-5)-methyltransferase 1
MNDRLLPEEVEDMEEVKALSFFAGIGAFDLGLERAGFEIVGHSEIDPYASAVLRKHWPRVPNLGDATTCDVPIADALFAGFPCQDLSNAGKRAGLSGARSGLFYGGVMRAVRLARPRIVGLENVAALHNRGLGDVLGALAALGYDAEVDCIPASYVGAPHDRDRTWIVAHSQRCEWRQEPYRRALGRMGRQQQSVPWDRDWQSALCEFRGMDDGTAYRVDRIDTLRNALVPQIAEGIGQAIKAATASEERMAA